MIFFYGMLSLFGFVIFAYFYWQAHYSFKFSLRFYLLFACVGLLIYSYGFLKFVQSVLKRDDESESICNYSHKTTSVDFKVTERKAGT